MTFFYGGFGGYGDYGYGGGYDSYFAPVYSAPAYDFSYSAPVYSAPSYDSSYYSPPSYDSSYYSPPAYDDFYSTPSSPVYDYSIPSTSMPSWYTPYESVYSPPPAYEAWTQNDPVSQYLIDSGNVSMGDPYGLVYGDPDAYNTMMSSYLRTVPEVYSPSYAAGIEAGFDPRIGGPSDPYYGSINDPYRYFFAEPSYEEAREVAEDSGAVSPIMADVGNDFGAFYDMGPSMASEVGPVNAGTAYDFASSGSGSDAGIMGLPSAQLALAPSGIMSDVGESPLQTAMSRSLNVEGGAAPMSSSGSGLQLNSDGSSTVTTPNGQALNLNDADTRALIEGRTTLAELAAKGEGSTRLSPTTVAAEQGLSLGDASGLGPTGRPLANDPAVAAYEREMADLFERQFVEQGADQDAKPTSGYYDEITGKFISDPLGPLQRELDNTSGTGDIPNSWFDRNTRTWHYIDENGIEQTYKDTTSTFKPMTSAEIQQRAGALPQVSGKAGSGGGGGGTPPQRQQQQQQSKKSDNAKLAALLAAMALMNKGDKSGGALSAAQMALLRQQEQAAREGRRAGSDVRRYFSGPGLQRKAEGGITSLDGYAGGGGIASLGGYSDGGRLLKGPGDGVSDSIPATIGKQRKPARLADGEFVVPARIVSELGNGSTEAGARKLYAMMERIQRDRRKSVGKDKVAVNSRADKHLPA